MYPFVRVPADPSDWLLQTMGNTTPAGGVPDRTTLVAPVVEFFVSTVAQPATSSTSNSPTKNVLFDDVLTVIPVAVVLV
jgi:hypothetical protein